MRRKLKNAVDIDGDPIRDLDQYQLEWNASFQFSFVEPDKLTEKEHAVFEKTSAISPSEAANHVKYAQSPSQRRCASPRVGDSRL